MYMNHLHLLIQGEYGCKRFLRDGYQTVKKVRKGGWGLSSEVRESARWWREEEGGGERGGGGERRRGREEEGERGGGGERRGTEEGGGGGG